MSQIAASYIGHMGSDLTVANAARVSFDKASKWEYSSSIVPIYSGSELQGKDDRGYYWLPERDAKLIRFLATGYRTGEWQELRDSVRGCMDGNELNAILKEFKHKAQHWAPFAHPHVSLHVDMPIFLARQMVKHQIGGVWSEVSRRYVSSPPEFWFPETFHSRPADVKQGSGDEVTDSGFCHETAQRSVERAAAAYQALLAEGVAPEEARIVLPQNTMTTVVWTGSLLFWARVCNQRLDSHSQLAAQELAHQIAGIIRPRFPVSWKELVRWCE